MKKLLIWFFVTLGVVFFCLLVALSYLWIADPYELRPLFSSYRHIMSAPVLAPLPSDPVEVTEEAVPDTTEGADLVDANPNLTPAQEDALNLIGINPAALPSDISDEQMACFERVLGTDRVKAIIAGEVPSVVEILKANECL